MTQAASILDRIKSLEGELFLAQFMERGGAAEMDRIRHLIGNLNAQRDQDTNQRQEAETARDVEALEAITGRMAEIGNLSFYLCPRLHKQTLEALDLEWDQLNAKRATLNPGDL